MNKKKVLCVVGTRPEAIKMAPVILAIKQEPTLEVHVLAKAQHRHMLDQVMDEGGGVLSYRVYGRDLEARLTDLGFEVEYCKGNIPEFGILNTELYYCRKVA